MEEMNNPPHSMGSGQPHQYPVNHTRPFFYVQPPSQPYFLYQWHMNNPYGQYGFHGSGFPFGRSYMPPYPYMQYPGYVVPHAPMQPMDYRRMYNPHFPSAGAYDVRFRHHQTRTRRETASSEVQTDPSEAVNKLIESLGKMGPSDSSMCEKELDSGVASQTSAAFLPVDEQKPVHTSTRDETEPLPQRCTPTNATSGEQHVSSPMKRFTESAAVYDVDSNQSRLEDMVQQEGWSVSSCDGVLPLDSSSVHEDHVVKRCSSYEQSVAAFPVKHCLVSVQTDSSGVNKENQIAHGGNGKPEKVTGHGHQQTQGCEVASKQGSAPVWPSMEPLSSCLTTSNWLVQEGAEQGDEVVSKMPSPPEKCEEENEVLEKQVLDCVDLQYKILKLPFDRLAATEELHKMNPQWYLDSLSSLIPPASYLPTFGNAYYYSYYPQTSQERQSVLSPSLDELSSRDEMFSTDLEDLELMPSHVYTGGKLDHTTNEVQEPVDEGEIQNGSLHEELCQVCPKKKTCATCGSKLSKEHKKSKASVAGNLEVYEEAIEDETDIPKRSREQKKATNVKKPPHPKRVLQPCATRMCTKPKSKRGCCEEAEGSACQVEQEPCYPEGNEFCEEHKSMSKVEKHKGQETRNVQVKRQTDKQWREGTVTSDQESWESYGAKPRSKPWKPYPPSRGRDQERPSRKRASYKTVVYPKPRRNDEDDHDDGELPRVQRGRGSNKRRGTRY
ncbi:bucky ball [Amia ocellicauda]|uniref:bucky ball n=1 Tax=Amia ocellicauda TaxID=2972642 RepID=UPI003463F3B8